MDLGSALAEQERAWNERPLVRRQYGEWYRLIVESLADVGRPTVELGSGIGKLRQYKPDVVTTDIEPTPWADLVVDAEALPYEDGELGISSCSTSSTTWPIPLAFSTRPDACSPPAVEW